ncbi:YebC/PmpR family DNA-binding transcriptional regulator [Aphanothece hegewaldii CCALA 016]|uniref:Probable transcriptional regulatory protein C7H19_15950 n=1 Tax=Aphanothece hegewaldii CCALA 016 TaxID=2107694 RepID=A0A2T1LVH6_9CHRO|nr:YebC/PmpR family DNA-binding transcriptional regulator [Aphanothece hegewaldii]PSF35725.1 YebC/PmpR family DNA-binding transcriptional regulator [Aphanothece hegewaldii CCALA 016]
MAGHSKWANIKRQKARIDQKRGKTFTQLSRAIIVAARNGIPDPNGNFQLRTAIDKAKAAGIPNDNIERAIAIGSGTYNDGTILEEIRYEGYGLGGVAIIIQALTNNRNRTAADLRVAFSKNGGNLGETGCVSWMFNQKGVVFLAGEIEEDILLEASLEGGADTYEFFEDEDGKGVEVFTEVMNLDYLQQTLQKKGFAVQEIELRWIPSTMMEVHDLEQARSLLKLIDILESLDDVQTVTSNFEMSDELIAAFDDINSD